MPASPANRNCSVYEINFGSKKMNHNLFGSENSFKLAQLIRGEKYASGTPALHFSSSRLSNKCTTSSFYFFLRRLVVSWNEPDPRVWSGRATQYKICHSTQEHG